MSAKDLIFPYLNRFVSINQQMATAKLELRCKDGEVTESESESESEAEAEADAENYTLILTASTQSQ